MSVSLALLGCSSGDADGSGGGRSSPVAGIGGAGGASTAGSGGTGVSGFGSPPLVGTGATAGAGSAGGTAGQAGSGGAPSDCGAITETAEVMLGPVDIVWIIDGSASMLDEIAAVQENITNFANVIGGAGVDHHVVMLATTDVAGPTPLGMDAAHYLYVPAPVDSWNSLQLLLDLYPQYASFLRAEAPLHFIVVSDDESLLPATDFRTQMEALAGKQFIFHSIVSESVGGAPCVGACGVPFLCGGSAPGLQYHALSDATGGQKISICVADWSMVFGPLQDAVIASVPLPCDYTIPPPPDGETFDPDKVNFEFQPPGMQSPMVLPRADGEAACAQNLAWFYDDPAAPTQIRMCPAACTAISGGGTISIQLGCETVVFVPE